MRARIGTSPLFRCSVTAIATAAFVGCATAPADCDPTKGGFFGGIRGSASGCYAQRIENKQADIMRARARRTVLTQELSKVESEKTQVSRRLDEKQTQRDRAAAELSDVRGRLEADQAGNRELQQQAAALEQQLAGSSAETVDLKKELALKEKRIDELATESGYLENEIRELEGL